MYIYSNAKNRRSGTTMQKMPSRGSLRDYKARRAVLEGFPWTGRFSTREQIENYLAGDRITCLLCGKTFRSLHVHVRRTHQMDVDDYKERFGIPQHEGLHTQQLREDCRRRVYETSFFQNALTRDELKVLSEKTRALGVRRRPPALQAESLEKAAIASRDYAARQREKHGPILSKTETLHKRRRIICEGYPWKGKFQSAAEIDAYLAGDDKGRIACLICGQMHHMVGGSHLKMHGVTEDEYRERFGLRWRDSLASTSTSENYSRAVKARLEDPGEMKLLLERAEKARPLARTAKHRRLVDHVAAAHGERFRLYGDEDAEKFLARLTERAPRDVYKDDDVPGIAFVREYRQKNPEYEARYLAALEALPFAVQSRGKILGKRFRTALRRLFDEGLSDHRAANVLGVSAMVCNRITRHWRTSGDSADRENAEK